MRVRITRDQDDTGSVANRIAPKLPPVKKWGRPACVQAVIDKQAPATYRGRPWHIQEEMMLLAGQGIALADSADELAAAGNVALAKKLSDESLRLLEQFNLLARRYPVR